MNISEAIQTSNRLAITGFEGCGKSTKTIKALLEMGKPFIFACNSFQQVKEKQLWAINKLGLTEEECPIIAKVISPTNGSYLSTPTTPEHVSSNAKIVFCSHFYITKNYHSYNSRIKHFPVVIDEFRWEQILVPSVGIQAAIANKLNKTVTQHIKSQYGNEDAVLLFEAVDAATNTGNFTSKGFIAKWLSTSNQVIFLTSEKLAEEILSSVGFTILNLPTPAEELEGKIFQVASLDINEQWFNTMTAMSNWKALDFFDLIITDKSKDAKISNHTVIQGSNNHIDKTILVVLSLVPQSAINYITITLNDIMGTSYTYDQVASFFYRDRLCQAVGRNLGHRGAGPTYVACNKTIWENYLKPNYSGLNFPVGYTEWFDQLDKLQVLKSATGKEFVTDVVTNHFEYAPDVNMSKKDFDDYVQKNNLKRPTGATLKACDIEENIPFTKYCNITIGGKQVRGIRNLRIKEQN